MSMQNEHTDTLTKDHWEPLIIDALEDVLNTNTDGAHDIHHVIRVLKIARKIMASEAPVNPHVITASCLLHDCVSLPKNHPDRHTASQLAAEKARHILQRLNFSQDWIPAVEHAICSHSFSANIAPETLEAKIVQDADRIEALGYIGIARCFYTSGQLNRNLFHGSDPMGEHRELDDQSFALDHFQLKLLKLPATMTTTGGRRIAEKRAQVLKDFLVGLVDECGVF